MCAAFVRRLCELQLPCFSTVMCIDQVPFPHCKGQNMISKQCLCEMQLSCFSTVMCIDQVVSLVAKITI